MLRQLLAVACCLAPLSVRAASSKGASAKDVPSWVEELSSRRLPEYPGKVPAAVMLEEQHVTVSPSGELTVQTRHAVKILTADGRSQAIAAAPYEGTEKAPELRAWLIAPNGFIKAYGKKDTADVGPFSEWELYNDFRLRMIRDENPEIGAIFAYESESHPVALFAQDEFNFQTDLPCLQSRYVLTLPAGWTAAATVLNGAPIQPVVDGSTYTWELKNLPFREREVNSPEIEGLTPRLAVNFQPPDATNIRMRCFRSWQDISQWYSGLIAGDDAASPEITAQVAALTANAKSTGEKIRAISRYIQQIRYVEIQLNQIGGFKPHAPADVLRHQYGDCKDKANLMRAMLQAAGIPSYLVIIYAGDRTHVHKEWPSPSQFNHAIIAIQTQPGTPGPVIDVPQLGHLLIFDPTAAETPLGDLPWYEQGSYAFIAAGSKGDLVRMPVLAPDANLREIAVEATLSDTAELSASVSTTLRGDPADAVRAARAHESPDDFRKSLERLLYRSATEVNLASFTQDDHFDENSLHLRLVYTSPRYAHLMQGRLLVFSPSVIVPSAPELPVNANRKEPIVLRSRLYRKHVSIKLPPGFVVDEMPQDAHNTSEFASYSIKFSQNPGILILDEELRIQAVTLPPDEYARCKAFFDYFFGADLQQAVLVKN